MISEREFAEGFTGFWTGCIPCLTPQLIAELNLIGKPMSDGSGFVVKPLQSHGPSMNNDLVAEIAFGLFAAGCTGGKRVIALFRDQTIMPQIVTHARDRISRLRGGSNPQANDFSIQDVDALELAVRLENYFDSECGEKILVHPRLKGCGVLDSCHGDLFCDDCLYEVKMVDRNLRSVDLRQVLTYCALNYQSQQFPIKNACILNPRRGIALHFDLEWIARRTSGKSSAELFHQIIDFLASYETIHQV